MCKGSVPGKGVTFFGSVRKEYPSITIGVQAVIRFYSAATDEEKFTAAVALREILRQIDEG